MSNDEQDQSFAINQLQEKDFAKDLSRQLIFLRSQLPQTILHLPQLTSYQTKTKFNKSNRTFSQLFHKVFSSCKNRDGNGIIYSASPVLFPKQRSLLKSMENFLLMILKRDAHRMLLLHLTIELVSAVKKNNKKRNYSCH